METIVRPYKGEDHDFVLSLAERLMVGMPPWRNSQAWLAAVEGWIHHSIAGHPENMMIFIAEDQRAGRLGFASVTQTTHFTGEPQAYIGELAISQAAEGCGAGKALLEACEGWARHRGLRLISLTTGAANAHAIGFYYHQGYQDEDVTLIKLLDPSEPANGEGSSHQRLPRNTDSETTKP